MKREILLEAIGGIDESMLAATEKQQPCVRRKMWQMIAIPAAMIALAVSVAAATVLISVPILRGGVETNETTSMLAVLDGSTVIQGGINGYNVYMEVDAEETAPEKVEIPYTMKLPDQWDQIAGYYVGSDEWFQASWWLNPYKSVQLNQYTFAMAERNYGQNGVDRLWSMPKDAVVTSEIVNMAGVEMLRVTISALGMDKLVNGDGETRLYWSDGEYIMRLEYPSEISDEDIIAMLSTLRVEP